MKTLHFILAIPLMVATCLFGCRNINFPPKSNEAVADAMFANILDAMQTKEEARLIALFSKNIQKANPELQENARNFVEFLQGEIVSFSRAADSGVGVETEQTDGKWKQTIQSSFAIVTSEYTYYLAMKECTKDDFDPNNVGVQSIYIICEDNWKQEYVYRGEKEWAPGVHIVQG